MFYRVTVLRAAGAALVLAKIKGSATRTSAMGRIKTIVLDRVAHSGNRGAERFRRISLDPVCWLPGVPGARESGTVTFPPVHLVPLLRC